MASQSGIVRQLPSDNNYPFLFLDGKAPIAIELRCVYVTVKNPSHIIRNLAIKKHVNELDPAAREDAYVAEFERFKKHGRAIVISKKTCGDMQLQFLDGRTVPILEGLKTLNLMDPGNVACTLVPFQSVLEHILIGPLLDEKWPALARHVKKLEENLGKEVPATVLLPSLAQQLLDHAADVQARSKASKSESSSKKKKEASDGSREAVEQHSNGKKKRKDEKSGNDSSSSEEEPETKKTKVVSKEEKKK